MEYIFGKDALQTLLRTLKDDDMVRMSGAEFIELVGKNVTGRGRKPIEIDGEIFAHTAEMWQRGEITARQAMERLNLKPNTFYRRVKKWRNKEMTNLKSEIKEGLKAEKKELHELRKQVHQEAKEAKALADEKIEETVSLHRMERDIAHEKIAAELEHHVYKKNLQATVEAEKKEFKSL